MKTLIIQYFIDLKNYVNQEKVSSIRSTRDFIEKYSEISFRRYCEKYNHDFLRITEPKINYSHPTWERVDLWLDESWFDRYDQICYVDTDVFALPWAPDIFSFVDPVAFNKVPYWKSNGNNYKKIFNEKKLSTERLFSAGFQAGVFILTKESRDLSLNYISEYKDPLFKDDCALMIWSVAKSQCKINDMPLQFNIKWTPNMPFPKGVSNVDLKSLYFLHAFGNYKMENPNYYLKNLEEIYGKIY